MLTEEDIRKAKVKFPLADASIKFWVFTSILSALVWIPAFIVILDILGG